eukprot:8169134-Pyramimonas_sp.AAC.1
MGPMALGATVRHRPRAHDGSRLRWPDKRWGRRRQTISSNLMMMLSRTPKPHGVEGSKAIWGRDGVEGS